MPSEKRPGWTAMCVELPDELYAQLVNFCTDRDSTKAEEIRSAIRRHLAYPPPVKTDAPFGANKRKR